jgi:uncharacterized protein YggE
MSTSSFWLRLLSAVAIVLPAFNLMVVPMSDAQERAVRATERTVCVSASGSMSAEPDIAHVSTGVVTEAETARDALSRNTAAMKKVIDGLKGLGVDAKDIQTVAFNIEPRYPSKVSASSVPQINGYRVVNQVRVTARRLDRLGEVLDQLVTLGANQMHGLSFEVSKAETLKDEARKVAMANALRRARIFAEAAGAEVGPVLAISEDVAHTIPRGGVMARSAMAEAVPIERGSQSLEVRVSVTWMLK